MVKQQDSHPPVPPPSSESGSSLASPFTSFPLEKGRSLLRVHGYLYGSPSADHGFESPGPFSYNENSLSPYAYRSLPSPAPVATNPLPSPPRELTSPRSASAPCPCGSPPTPSPVRSPSNSAGPIAYPPRSTNPITYPPNGEPGPWRGITPPSWTSPPPTVAPPRSATPLSPRRPMIYSTPNKLPQPWKLSPPVGGPGHSPSPGASGVVQPFDGGANGIHRHYEAIVGVSIGAFFLFAIALLLLAMFFVKKKKYPRCFTAPNVADEATTGHGLKRSGSSLSPTTRAGRGTSPGMLPSTDAGGVATNDVFGAKAASSAGKRNADNNRNGIAQREAIHSGGLYDSIRREDSRGPARSVHVDKQKSPAEVKFNCCLDGQEAESLVVIGRSQRNGLDNAERPLDAGDRCNRQGKSVRTRNFSNGARLE